MFVESVLEYILAYNFFQILIKRKEYEVKEELV